MKHAAPATQRRRLFTGSVVQLLRLLSAAGTLTVQLTLLHICLSPSVTFLLPLPTAYAERILSVTALIATLLADWLLLSPFHLGIATFWYDTGGTATVPIGACFAAYRRRRYALALRWRLTMWGIRYGSAALCLLPAVSVFAYAAATTTVWRIPLYGAGVLFAVAGGIVWGLWMARYAATAFLVPEMGSVRAALHRSAHITKPHQNALIRTVFRFGGGFVSCLLVVPSLIVIPRFHRTLARQVRDWINNERLPENHLL